MIAVPEVQKRSWRWLMTSSVTGDDQARKGEIERHAHCLAELPEPPRRFGFASGQPWVVAADGRRFVAAGAGRVARYFGGRSGCACLRVGSVGGRDRTSRR